MTRSIHRYVIVLSLSFILSTILSAAEGNGDDWPRWRGPNGDGISLDKGLLKEWPEGGPKIAWRVDTLGEGYSCIAIKDGRIFTQGNLDGIEHVIALSAKDGSVLWAVQPEPVVTAVKARIAEGMARGDRNADGKLEEAEALPVLGWDVNKADRPLEGDAEKIATERTKRLLEALDKDGDGFLSKDEAGRAFLREFPNVDQEDEQTDAAEMAKKRTEALSKALDKDGDGQLARQEFRGSWLQYAGGRIDARDPETRRGDGILTKAEIEAYMNKFERGKDGQLSAQELRTYYARRFPQRDGIYTEEELRIVYGGFRHGSGNGPRGAPTVDGNRIYVEGGNGDVSCLDAASGETFWHVSLTRNFGGGIPHWGYSESPLIEGDMVIVTPGGREGTVVALNKNTGELVWRSDEVKQAASYSSPVAATIGGIRQIVQFANETVFGLTADKGRLTWQYKHARKGTINITTPIVFKDHCFVSSAYRNGGGLAKITTSDGKQRAEEVYFRKQMDNHHGGIIKVGDYIYGFGSSGGRGLICMDFMTGEIAWRDKSVSKGSLTVADGMLYLLGEGHEVALAEATHEGYSEHGRFRIERHGKPSWTHPVVAGGRFYIRDQHTLTAYDVRAK